MAWRVEFGPAASEDLRVIFRNLRASHEGFGNPLLLAANMAADRVHAIRRNAERLADAPHIGTRVTLGGEAFRYVTMDSAILSVSEKNCIACSLPLPTVEREQR